MTKKLNNEFIKKIAHAYAYDLLRYSENGGDMQNITAAKVYSFLETLDTKKTLPNQCQSF